MEQLSSLRVHHIRLPNRYNDTFAQPTSAPYKAFNYLAESGQVPGCPGSTPVMTVTAAVRLATDDGSACTVHGITG